MPLLYLLYCTAVYRACTVSPVSFLLLLGCSHTGHVAAARLVKALLTADPLSTHYEPEDGTLPPRYHHGHTQVFIVLGVYNIILFSSITILYRCVYCEPSDILQLCCP